MRDSQPYKIEVTPKQVKGVLILSAMFLHYGESESIEVALHKACSRLVKNYKYTVVAGKIMKYLTNYVKEYCPYSLMEKANTNHKITHLLLMSEVSLDEGCSYEVFV
jgi:uncharacterized membrane-anchored protein